MTRQRTAELTETIERLETESLTIRDAITSVRLLYQEFGRIHSLRLPAPADTVPRTDYEHARKARAYRIGGRAAQALGILIFAGLGVAAVNLDLAPLLTFMAFAILGALFCIVVSAIVAMTTKAGARNPGAERTLRRLAAIAGAVAGISAAGLLCSRFVEDGPLVTLIPHLIVCFEVSIVVMGASLEAAHGIYTWSAELEAQYEASSADYDRLQRERSAAAAELKQLQAKARESEEQEKTHEHPNVHAMVNGPAAAGMHTEHRTGNLNN